MTTVISPTIGRIVWFWLNGENTVSQPEAGVVTKVWNDRMVNLAVFDMNGHSRGVTSVILRQQGDPRPEVAQYATWMPFQLGQAKKTEEAEAKSVGADVGVQQSPPA